MPTTVHITDQGNQTISGIKTFQNSIIVNTISGTTGINYSYGLDRFNLNLQAMDNVYIPAPFVSGGGGIKIVGGSGSWFGGPIGLFGGRGPNEIYDGGVDIRSSSITFNAADTSNIGKSVTVYKTGSHVNLNIGQNSININNEITVSGNVSLSSGTLTASNLVYNTGNQTISGVKTFDSLPTVRGTGVLLSGQNSFILNFVTTQSSTNASLGYFGNFAAGYGNDAASRAFPVLENCVARKIVFSTQLNTTFDIPFTTGYFINTTQNITGTIPITTSPAVVNTLYNYVGNINVPINTGDNVVCLLKTTGVIPTFRSIAQVYCYN